MRICFDAYCEDDGDGYDDDDDGDDGGDDDGDDDSDDDGDDDDDNYDGAALLEGTGACARCVMTIMIYI